MIIMTNINQWDYLASSNRHFFVFVFVLRTAPCLFCLVYFTVSPDKREAGRPGRNVTELSSAQQLSYISEDNENVVITSALPCKWKVPV